MLTEKSLFVCHNGFVMAKPLEQFKELTISIDEESESMLGTLPVLCSNITVECKNGTWISVVDSLPIPKCLKESETSNKKLE